MKNKKILLAPLMGAFISVFIFSIYLLTIVNYKTTSFINIAFSLLEIVPLMGIFFVFISYITCFLIGIPLIFIKNKYLLSPNMFWLLSFFIFLILGNLAGIINYQSQTDIVKSIAITLSFTFGGIFSASLYSILNGDVKPPP